MLYDDPFHSNDVEAIASIICDRYELSVRSAKHGIGKDGSRSVVVT